MPRTEDRSAVGSKRIDLPDRPTLRARIIEEHYLKESVDWEKALRTEHPELWQKVDAARIEGNQALAELNLKLRSAGPSDEAQTVAVAENEETATAAGAQPCGTRDLGEIQVRLSAGLRAARCWQHAGREAR